MKNNEQQPILTGTSSHEVQSNPVTWGEENTYKDETFMLAIYLYNYYIF